jgi:hypothetical protein
VRGGLWGLGNDVSGAAATGEAEEGSGGEEGGEGALDEVIGGEEVGAGCGAGDAEGAVWRERRALGCRACPLAAGPRR